MWGVELVPIEFDGDRPWIRQPFDTDTRWRAFVAYRDQQPPRTIRGVIEALTGAGHPAAVSRLEQWSTANAWPERCLEYDRHLDLVRVAATEALLAEDARTTAGFHIELLRDAQMACRHIVKGWLDRIAAGEELDGWSAGEVRGMIKDTITLERLVRGQATERVEHGIVDLSALSTEEIETILVLQEKAGAAL